MKITLALFAVLFAAKAVLAAGMVELAPAKVEQTLFPGETRVQEFILRNNSDASIRVELQFEDFTSSESKVVQLLGGDRSQYSLADYLSSTQTVFTLEPGSSRSVPVTISLPAGQASGAYYGSVLFSLSRESAGQVKIASRLGALVFVRVAGQAQSAGELKEFAWHDSKFSFLFENNGEVYLNPYGFVVVKNWWGREVWLGEIEPNFVLPQSSRHFELPLIGMLSPGFYQAEINLNRGYDNIVDQRSTRFWHQPLALWRWSIAAVVIIWLGRQIFLKLRR